MQHERNPVTRKEQGGGPLARVSDPEPLQEKKKEKKRDPPTEAVGPSVEPWLSMMNVTSIRTAVFFSGLTHVGVGGLLERLPSKSWLRVRY